MRPAFLGLLCVSPYAPTPLDNPHGPGRTWIHGSGLNEGHRRRNRRRRRLCGLTWPLARHHPRDVVAQMVYLVDLMLLLGLFPEQIVHASIDLSQHVLLFPLVLALRIAPAPVGTRSSSVSAVRVRIHPSVHCITHLLMLTAFSGTRRP